MDSNLRNTAAHIIPQEEFQFGYSTEDDHRITTETTPFLNIDKLREEERSTEKTRRKMYKLILAKCHSKIRRTNNTTDFRECFFDIPIFLPGFPVYSVKEAKKFVLKKLHENGIYAQVNGPTRIYISWKNNDVNYDQYKVQAEKMVPKNNVYKIGISPMDARFNNPAPRGEKRKAKLWNDLENSGKVSMFQYDTRYHDMIPVNTEKMSQQYPELNEKKSRKPSYLRRRRGDYDDRGQRDYRREREHQSHYEHRSSQQQLNSRRDHDDYINPNPRHRRLDEVIDLDRHYRS